MMKNQSTYLAAACALLLATGAVAKESRKPDAWITTKVKSTLATHKNVSAFDTHVETKKGFVTLTGDVDTMAEKELVTRYAREVEGVRGVNNRLEVKSAVADPTVATEGAGDSALHEIGDATLTARIKTALMMERETSAFHTDVDTERGAVTLIGTAKSGAERDLAEKVVRKVEGVKSVDNRIEVK